MSQKSGAQANSLQQLDRNTAIDEDLRESISKSISNRRGNLTAKPTIHQRFVEIDGKLISTASQDRKVSWLELLFDLAIVYAAEKAVEGFKSDSADRLWTAPFIYVIKMATILSVWGNVDNYINRYGRSESLFDCMYVLLQSIAIFCVSATIEIYADSQDDDHEQRKCLSGFAIGIAFAHFFQLIAQARVAILLPDSRAFSASLLMHTAIWTILWLIVGVMPGDLYATWVLLTIAAVGDFFREYIWLGIKQLIPFEKLNITYIFIPMNIELAMDRSGLLLLIAVGEVTSAVAGHALSASDFGSIIMAVVLGFYFKFMYFDIFDAIGEDVEVIALNRSREHAMAYLKLHVVTVLAVILCSYHLVQHDDEEDDLVDDDEISETYNQLVFACSASVAMMSMYTMGRLHAKPELHVKSQRVPKIFRTCFLLLSCAVMITIAGSYEFRKTRVFIGVCLVILGLCMLLEYLCEWILLDLDRLDKAFAEIMELDDADAALSIPMKALVSNPAAAPPSPPPTTNTTTSVAAAGNAGGNGNTDRDIERAAADKTPGASSDNAGVENGDPALTTANPMLTNDGDSSSRSSSHTAEAATRTKAVAVSRRGSAIGMGTRDSIIGTGAITTDPQKRLAHRRASAAAFKDKIKVKGLSDMQFLGSRAKVSRRGSTLTGSSSTAAAGNGKRAGSIVEQGGGGGDDDEDDGDEAASKYV